MIFWRAVLVYLLILMLLATSLSGLSNMEEIEGPHAIYGLGFFVIALAHILTNRKALSSYIKKYKSELLVAIIIFIMISVIAFAMGARELEFHEHEFEYED